MDSAEKPLNATTRKEALPVNSSGAEPMDSSRRNFSKAGIVLSGVLLTLTSRPVLGDTRGLSPSGFLSGNVSSHGNLPPCEGRSPGYWKNHPEAWPIPSDTKFHSVFPCITSSAYYHYTLIELITGCATSASDSNCVSIQDAQNLGMHLVAAYLNALCGWTPCLNIETIKSMFSEWQSKGTFSPAAGVYWDAGQIVTYLQSTMS
jgi:hypothetical protein